MDCLDRTNVIESVFAREVLQTVVSLPTFTNVCVCTATVENSYALALSPQTSPFDGISNHPCYHVLVVSLFPAAEARSDLV